MSYKEQVQSYFDPFLSNPSFRMKIFFILFTVLGLGFAGSPSRSLQDDFKDIISIIPIEEYRAIAQDHMSNDEEFRSVVKYLQGPKWAALVADVKAKPAVQEFNKYLLEAGIDMEKVLAYIHDLVANAKPKSMGTRSFRSFLDEVEELFPIEEFSKILFEKLETSEEFIELYEKVQATRPLVNEIAKIPEVQRLKEKLVELGVNVDAIILYVRMFLAWL